MKVLCLILTVLLLGSCSSRYYSSTDIMAALSTSIKFSENPGTSFNDAIVVYGVKSSAEAIAAEYHYISTKHGKRGIDWFLIGQTIIANQQKVVDVVEYHLNIPGERRVIYFDAGHYIN